MQEAGECAQMRVPFPVLVWVGDKLQSLDGQVLASVRAEVLEIEEHRLLVEAFNERLFSFKVRATDRDGNIYTLRKESFTLKTLRAVCQDRHYLLERTSAWRRARRILHEGDTVASTKALVSGKFLIEDINPNMLLSDLAFITMGAKLLDVPARQRLAQ